MSARDDIANAVDPEIVEGGTARLNAKPPDTSIVDHTGREVKNVKKLYPSSINLSGCLCTRPVVLSLPNWERLRNSELDLFDTLRGSINSEMRNVISEPDTGWDICAQVILLQTN